MNRTPPAGAVSLASRPGRRTDSGPERPSLAGAALAELLGTFVLLFFGVGTVLALGGAGDPAQKLTIGLAFGLAILAMAYALGHVSGAHLNPAVTLGQALSGRFPLVPAAAYVVAQLVGAVLGVLAAEVLLGEANDVAISVTAPGPGIGTGQAFLAEVLLGFVLMLVVKGTAVDDRAEGHAAGMAIGLTVTAGHLAMIPVSGSSFNPARSVGSAVVSGELGDLWIYLVAPCVGAVAAAVLYERVLRQVRAPTVDEVPGPQVG